MDRAFFGRHSAEIRRHGDFPAVKRRHVGVRLATYRVGSNHLHRLQDAPQHRLFATISSKFCFASRPLLNAFDLITGPKRA